MQAPVSKMAMIVGLPESARGQLLATFKGDVDVHTILLEQRGGMSIDQPPQVAVARLERLLDKVSSYDDLCVVVLPYHKRIDLVEGFLSAFEDVGGKVYRVSPGQHEWVKIDRKKGMERDFQRVLVEQICACLDEWFPEPEIQDGSESVKFELLRGLASHNKMGKNNHSHEDDFWKERGAGLGSRTRAKIVKELMVDGLIGRKKNKSAGGTGWVYWIEDVQLARARFPELDKYIG